MASWIICRGHYLCLVVQPEQDGRRVLSSFSNIGILWQYCQDILQTSTSFGRSFHNIPAGQIIFNQMLTIFWSADRAQQLFGCCLPFISFQEHALHREARYGKVDQGNDIRCSTGTCSREQSQSLLPYKLMYTLLTVADPQLRKCFKSPDIESYLGRSWLYCVIYGCVSTDAGSGLQSDKLRPREGPLGNWRAATTKAED